MLTYILHALYIYLGLSSQLSKLDHDLLVAQIPVRANDSEMLFEGVYSGFD